LGALLLSVAYKRFSWLALKEALQVTMKLTSMILLIVVGGVMFTSIFILLGGSKLITDIIAFMEFGPTGVIALFLAIVFVAGFVLDWTSVVVIVVPRYTPIVNQRGIDPIWFAVMLLVVIQTAYLTTPMAPSIFYLRGVAPNEFTYGDMYAGVAPFVGLQILTLLIVA